MSAALDFSWDESDYDPWDQQYDDVEISDFDPSDFDDVLISEPVSKISSAPGLVIEHEDTEVEEEGEEDEAEDVPPDWGPDVTWANPGTTGFDRELFRRGQWDRIWAPHIDSLPAGALLAICREGRGPRGPIKFGSSLVRVDFDAVCAEIEKWSRHCSMWISVAFLDGGPDSELYVGSGSRGKKTQIAGLPAIFLDADIAGPGHKSKSLPSLEQVTSMLDAVEIQPSVSIVTGGGYQNFYSLTEILTPDGLADHPDQILLERWAERLTADAKGRGFHWDEGVPRDSARVLRILGTSNHKVHDNIRPTGLVETANHRPYTRDELDALLPQLPPAPVRKPRKVRTVTTTGTATSVPEDFDAATARPGDLLARLYPVGKMLVEALDWRLDGDRLTCPRDDGTYSEESHAQLFDDADDGIQRVAIFGERAAELLKVEEGNQSSWDILCALVDKDFAVATRLASTATCDLQIEIQEIFAQLVMGTDLSIVMGLIPKADLALASGSATATFSPPPCRASDRPFELKGQPVSWPTAVAAGTGWAVIDRDLQAGSMLFARADPGARGVWEMKIHEIKEAQGNIVQVAKYSRISAWVGWRSSVVETRRGDQKTGDTSYLVKVLDQRGRVLSKVLTERESISPDTIQERMGGVISLPVSVVDRMTLRNVLSIFGSEDRVEDATYACTGWITVDGKAVFAAPAGSVSAAGVVEVPVDFPEGSSAEALTGWAAVPTTVQEHRDGIRAVAGLRTISPNRPDLFVATVGLLFSAPMALTNRTTLCVQGTTNFGKSLVMEAAYGFLSSASGRTFPISIPDASVAASAIALSWSRHLVLPADDFRMSADGHSKNQVATAVFGAIAQAAYQQVATKRATKTGTARSTTPVEATGMISAEVLPKEAAYTNRCVIIELGKDDVDRVDSNGIRGSNAVDQYRRDFSQTGLSRLAFAGFLQHLASRMDTEFGSLAALTRFSDAEKTRHRGTYASERSGEHVSALAVGWDALFAYAESVQAADLLPSRAEVASILAGLESDTAREHSLANPATAILDTIGDMVASGQGYISEESGREPIGRELVSGYALRAMMTSSGQENIWDHRGTLMGVWSRDSRYICLTKAGLAAAQRVAHLDGLHPSQIVTAVAGKCVPGSKPFVDRASRIPLTFELGSRNTLKRGFLIDPVLIGIDIQQDVIEHSSGAAPTQGFTVVESIPAVTPAPTGINGELTDDDVF